MLFYLYSQHVLHFSPHSHFHSVSNLYWPGATVHVRKDSIKVWDAICFFFWH